MTAPNPLATPPEAKAWEWNHAYDSAATWSAFQYYLRCPQPRRFRVVASAFHTSEAQIRNWARQGNWIARALAFDKELQAELLAEHTEAVRETAAEVKAKHLEILRMSRSILERELEKMHAESLSLPSAALTPKELIRMLSEQVKNERLVMGQATEIHEQNIDLTRLSDEELEEIDRLQRKATKE